MFTGTIEEGRAASKNPHKNLAIFFLFPSKQFLPILLKIQLVQYLNDQNIFTVLKKDLNNVAWRKLPIEQP
jgi:hypothetical protein